MRLINTDIKTSIVLIRIFKHVIFPKSFGNDLALTN